MSDARLFRIAAVALAEGVLTIVLRLWLRGSVGVEFGWQEEGVVTLLGIGSLSGMSIAVLSGLLIGLKELVARASEVRAEWKWFKK